VQTSTHNVNKTRIRSQTTGIKTEHRFYAEIVTDLTTWNVKTHNGTMQRLNR